MSGLDLEALYGRPRRIVVTAHRGDSINLPENTIPAFLSAAQKGADLIEFDVRGSLERVPVILHDQTVDRRSNGRGSVGSMSLAELKGLDFSKAMTSQPVTIPTLEEALQSIPETSGLNVQVKETDECLLARICALFDEHRLYRRAYLTVSTFADAEKVRSVNPRVQLCVLERKKALDAVLLEEMRAFGCRFLQPHRRDLSPQLCETINAMGFLANVYYSNTVQDHRRFIAWGMKGILTDDPSLLVDTLKRMNLFK